MKATTKRMLFISTSLLFFIASILVYSYMISPSYDKINKLRTKLAVEEMNYIHNKNTIDKVKNLLDKLNKNSNVSDQISFILPNSPKVGYFMNQIMELSRINGLGLNSISTKIKPSIPSKITSIKSIGILDANISASGSWAGFKSFLKQIEQNMFIMDIDKINIEKGKDSKDLKYRIVISSYYQSN